MFSTAFISCDHAGKDLQEKIIPIINNLGIEVQVLECSEEMDYTDVAKAVSKKVLDSQNSFGILICGSGVGVSITANRQKGIRAALCHLPEISRLSRLHNNANVLCLGGRIIPLETQIEIIKMFISTEFEGGRHLKRIQKIEI